MPKQVKGFWLPDAELHLVPYLENGPMFAGGPTYQFQKFALTFPYIRNFRHAVDAGAHCGLWTRVMAHCFGGVTAFEPLPEHLVCLKRNIRGLGNVRIHECALGAQVGTINIASTDNNTGMAAVSLKGGVEVKLATLDSFPVEDLDFLKIDCEGFEYFVIKGGSETIKRLKPTVIVEQKPGHAERYGLHQTEAVDLLVSWGARVRFEVAGDYCLTFY